MQPGAFSQCFLPRPVRSQEFPDGALREVLRSKSVYDVDDDTTVTSYDPEKLKVLRGNTRPLPAVGLVSDDARRFLENPEELVVKSADELLDVGESVTPFWDARLAKDRSERRALIDRLHKVGLITWRREARCHIGVFFVRKKLDQIRMVLDCRPVNQLHRPPPKSRLATPGALATLNLAEEWSQLSSQTGVAPTMSVAGASIDLQDGYYQFECENLSSWFCLGETYSVDALGLQQIFDEPSRSYSAAVPGERVWACFRGLPMGWSWALFFCHSALEEAGRRALVACRLPPITLADWEPSPPFTHGSAVVAP